MTSSLLLLLQQQLKQLVQMNELLLCEREAFANRQPAADIEAINQQKTDALTQIQAIDQQISTNYTQTDFNSDDVQQVRRTIDSTLTELKMNNEVNGKIIQNSQMNINMLKEVFVGSISGGKDRSAMTYNQSGRKSSLLKSRPIKA